MPGLVNYSFLTLCTFALTVRLFAPAKSRFCGGFSNIREKAILRYRWGDIEVSSTSLEFSRWLRAPDSPVARRPLHRELKSVLDLRPLNFQEARSRVIWRDYFRFARHSPVDLMRL